MAFLLLTKQLKLTKEEKMKYQEAIFTGRWKRFATMEEALKAKVSHFYIVRDTKLADVKLIVKRETEDTYVLAF